MCRASGSSSLVLVGQAIDRPTSWPGCFSPSVSFKPHNNRRPSGRTTPAKLPFPPELGRRPSSWARERNMTHGVLKRTRGRTASRRQKNGRRFLSAHPQPTIALLDFAINVLKEGLHVEARRRLPLNRHSRHASPRLRQDGFPSLDGRGDDEGRRRSLSCSARLRYLGTHRLNVPTKLLLLRLVPTTILAVQDFQRLDRNLEALETGSLCELIRAGLALGPFFEDLMDVFSSPAKPLGRLSIHSPANTRELLAEQRDAAADGANDGLLRH